MSSLFERARLTEEEVNAFDWHYDAEMPDIDQFRNAATHKALLAAAEWLEEKYDGDALLLHSTDWYRGYMAAVYDLRLAAAGANLPQVEAKP